jgi:hypothetical protein
VKTTLALLIAVPLAVWAAPPAQPPVPLPPGYHGPVPAPPRVSPYPPGYSCRAAKVVIDDFGDIYKDDTKLGSGAQDFKAACNGDVAWRDAYEHVRRNTQDLGGSVQTYEIAFNTGNVAWLDTDGSLFRDEVRLGGSISQWQLVGFTGDVVWTDTAQRIYKNGRALGNGAVRFDVSRFTGTVGWLDVSNNLYKEDRKIASDVSTFSFNADGRLSWQDLSGATHSEK